TETNGTFREVKQNPVSYVETNLLRCSFSQVSTTAQYFDVKILINNANSTSNSERLFITSPNPSLDPSIASNYLPVQRYMCRDIIQMKQNTVFYKSNLLDPQLWDLSQSYNLYTTSFGLDYGAI